MLEASTTRAGTEVARVKELMAKEQVPHGEGPGVPENSRRGDERAIESSELFQGTKEVIIHHGGGVYRLIITRNNKLILHK